MFSTYFLRQSGKEKAGKVCSFVELHAFNFFSAFFIFAFNFFYKVLIFL